MKTKTLVGIISLVLMGILIWFVPILLDYYNSNNLIRDNSFLEIKNEDVDSSKSLLKEDRLSAINKSKDQSVKEENGLYIMNESVATDNKENNGLSIMNKHTENKDDTKNPTIKISTNEKTSHIEITAEYCDSECIFFINYQKDFEYCQQVCNILPTENVSREDCKIKKNLEKDYCYKDLANKQKDLTICDEINDTNVKSTCKNRIMQNILEEN